MKIPKEFLDINGLVLPSKRDGDKPADNGVYFSSIAVLLGFDVPNYQQLIQSCFLKPGLLARWPGNNFDQCAWDDYLGVASACIRLNLREIPRQILWYALTHFSIFNTDKKLESKDFLLRNFPIWPLMWCAAFPCIRYIMYPILFLVQKFFNDPSELLKRNDTSGLQLQWVFLRGCYELGFNFKSSMPHFQYISAAFKIYYGVGHPFITWTTEEECEHEETDHGICLDCDEDISDELTNKAHEYLEGER